MNFDVQIVHSVDEITAEAWNRLSGKRPFSSHRWYRYGEMVLTNNEPIYIILSQNGEPIARATFWLRREEQLPISAKPIRRLLGALIRRRPLLICRSPLVEASGLILPDPPLRADAIETITEVARQQARTHNASFTGFVYLNSGTAQAEWPSSLTATEVPVPFTRLLIQWPDFDAYYDSLSSNTKGQYRRNCNRARDLNIEVHRRQLEGPLDQETLDQAVAQIWDVERHHNAAPTPWARRLLKYAYMVNGTWITTTIDDRLVGNFTVVGDGPVAKMTMLGRDYDVDYAYFQLIYTAIRVAIEEGFQELWGGSGVYWMKQRFGFELVENNKCIFMGSGPYDLLGRLAMRWRDRAEV